jgi:hypothetical protein
MEEIGGTQDLGDGLAASSDSRACLNAAAGADPDICFHSQY